LQLLDFFSISHEAGRMHMAAASEIISNIVKVDIKINDMIELFT